MIALASDHGGYAMKEALKKHLEELGLEYRDYGTTSDARCDYPIYAEAAARAVASGEAARGVVICTTGVGVSIAANKVRGIRCALCSDCYTAEMTRRHNNANMLAMGASVIGQGLANKLLDIFLNTPYEGGDGSRHARRLELIAEIERRERG